MTDTMRDYYAARGRVEREAVDRSLCSKARGIHLELADRYAKLAEPRSRLSLRF